MEFITLIYWLLVAFLGLLQIGDIHSTYVALTQISWIKEKNPIIQKAIDLLGLKAGLIVPKSLFVVIVWYLGEPTWWHVGTLAMLSVFYIRIVLNNYRIVHKYTGSIWGKV